MRSSLLDDAENFASGAAPSRGAAPDRRPAPVGQDDPPRLRLRPTVSTAAILAAAGSGSRLGARVPKALVPLAGVPLVVHAARRLARSGVIDLLVVTVPAAFVDEFRTLLDGADLALPVTLTVGGASRQASVAAALAGLPPGVDVVLVHDAARALAPPSLVARVAAAVLSGQRAVVPGAPVTDTIVQVGPGGSPAALEVVANPDRMTLRIVQTPQGFDRAVLDRAHTAAAHRAGDEAGSATDDASLVAALGEAVHVVPGDADAAKITTERDLALAELALAELVRAQVSATESAVEVATESAAELAAGQAR